MTLVDWRLIVDFGLLILIWMTQLVVYPSFARYKEEDLRAWHPTYNQRITIIVLPLMFSQLGLVIWQIGFELSWYTLASAVLVISTWALTFLQAVPLHGKIHDGVEVKLAAQQLVKVNWSRTVLWTLLFGLSLAVKLI